MAATKHVQAASAVHLLLVGAVAELNPLADVMA
jgi:hypothetical protein